MCIIIFFFFTYIILPIKTPKANNRMKGLLLPYFNLHLSLKLPKIGVTKKPIRGLSAQTRVICWWSTPIFNKVGETNAVSAAYENSIPITAADTRTNSPRVFFLENISTFILDSFLYLFFSIKLNNPLNITWIQIQQIHFYFQNKIEKLIVIFIINSLLNYSNKIIFK